MNLIVTRSWDYYDEECGATPVTETLSPSDVDNTPISRILNEYHIANLEHLSKYLSKLEAGKDQCGGVEFKMDKWCSSAEDPRNTEYICGTAACAVGHGPAAGIFPGPTTSSWFEYCTEEFCPTGTPLFRFMFGPDHVNCPNAAARRINYVLTFGLPDVINISYAEVEEVEDR